MHHRRNKKQQAVLAVIVAEILFVNEHIHSRLPVFCVRALSHQ